MPAHCGRVSLLAPGPWPARDRSQRKYESLSSFCRGFLKQVMCSFAPASPFGYAGRSGRAAESAMASRPCRQQKRRAPCGFDDERIYCRHEANGTGQRDTGQSGQNGRSGTRQRGRNGRQHKAKRTERAERRLRGRFRRQRGQQQGYGGEWQRTGSPRMTWPPVRAGLAIRAGLSNLQEFRQTLPEPDKPLKHKENGRPCWARTSDQGIMSPLL